MASFYSEKSLVKKKRRKANGVNRSRIQREQRERERIRREKEELLKLKRYNAATTISSTFRRYKSNLLLLEKIWNQLKSGSNNIDQIMLQFKSYLKLQKKIVEGERTILSDETENLFVNVLCKELLTQQYFSKNATSNHTEFTLKIVLCLMYKYLGRNVNISNVENVQILIKIMLATTYDLQLPTQKKISENNAMFIASTTTKRDFNNKNSNNTQNVFFCLLQEVLTNGNNASNEKELIKNLINILKIALDSSLNNKKYDDIADYNIKVRNTDIMKVFFIHIYANPLCYNIVINNNNALKRICEKKDFYLYIINMIAKTDDILMAISPKNAKHVLELINTLHQQFFDNNDFNDFNPIFMKAASILMLRIPINYFYQRYEMPKFYRQNSFDPNHNSNNSKMVIDTSIDGDDDEADYHNSDSDSDDDANTFNENWDEAGDSKMVITNIQSQMRKLARSPKRKSGISSPSLATISPRANNNSKKFLDYIDKNDYVQDFERITLNSLTGNLNGSTIISNLLMRWGTPYIFFHDEGKGTDMEKEKEKVDDNSNIINGVKMTGAPLKDLINHYTWLDSEVINLVYYGQCNRDVSLTTTALNNMLEGGNSNDDNNIGNKMNVDMEVQIDFFDQVCDQMPSKQARDILVYLMGEDTMDSPPYLKLWNILNTKFDLAVLSGNDEIANAVPGLSEALFIFITMLYIAIKNQSDDAFYELQKPFNLSTDLSNIVMMLQSIMSRLSGNTYSVKKVKSAKHTVNLVLYLASLKLFEHLNNRHKKKPWIRNSSSLDSEMLKAVEIDRNIMKEQDEAFKLALAADQSMMDTNSNVETTSGDMETNNTTTTTTTTSESKEEKPKANNNTHSGNTVGTSNSNDGLTDRERRAKFFENKFKNIKG